MFTLCLLWYIYQTIQEQLIMTVSSYIGISELSEVRGEVISQSLPSTWECHSTDEEDEQYQVGEAGSEVHHLQTQK